MAELLIHFNLLLRRRLLVKNDWYSRPVFIGNMNWWTLGINISIGNDNELNCIVYELCSFSRGETNGKNEFFSFWLAIVVVHPRFFSIVSVSIYPKFLSWLRVASKILFLLALEAILKWVYISSKPTWNG